MAVDLSTTTEICVAQCHVAKHGNRQELEDLINSTMASPDADARRESKEAIEESM